MLVLGIESSCDETGLALYCTQQGLVGHQLHSQIDMHALYGGVVPELASRDHIQRLVPLLRALLYAAKIEAKQIDAVAYTKGPGLVGALMTGACFAKSLASAWQVPALGVHHMEGHLLAPMLAAQSPEFPFVALLVSGGHTQLVAVEAIGRYKLLGESLDDAAGEAFDKSAKLMGLPYPGGPHLAKRALQGRPDRFRLPRPMLDRPGLDFSFSGLKTAVRTHFQALDDPSEQDIADLCLAFEQAAIDTLVQKSIRALKQTGFKTLVVAGGVSANLYLRNQLEQAMCKRGWQAYYPPMEFCTDNGAMIALAGALRLQAGQYDQLPLALLARWPLTDLQEL